MVGSGVCGPSSNGKTGWTLPRRSRKSHPIYTLFRVSNFAQRTSRLLIWNMSWSQLICLASRQRVPCQATATVCLPTCMLLRFVRLGGHPHTAYLWFRPFPSLIFHRFYAPLLLATASENWYQMHSYLYKQLSHGLDDISRKWYIYIVATHIGIMYWVSSKQAVRKRRCIFVPNIVDHSFPTVLSSLPLGLPPASQYVRQSCQYDEHYCRNTRKPQLPRKDN